MRKAIVTDCDGTLWWGAVGEDDLIPNLHLQEQLLDLKGRGVILNLCTSNSEEISKFLATTLSLDDFTTCFFDSTRKVTDIRIIADTLGISLDSIVFLDDSPKERYDVLQVLPEVFTIDPRNPRCSDILEGAFQVEVETEEDKIRTAFYREERARQDLQRSLKTQEEFIAELVLQVTIERAKAIDIDRIYQMFQRTNRFNLTGAKIPRNEVVYYVLGEPYFQTFVLRAVDKFGDYGLVGVAVIVQVDDSWEIREFLMSCRALGRGLESKFLQHIIDLARREGMGRIKGETWENEKNKNSVDFYQKQGFASERQVWWKRI